MSSKKQRWLIFVVLSLTLMTVTPVAAGPGAQQAQLPPPPEWPIIGPILRWLGIGEDAPAEPLPTPDPEMPSLVVESLEAAEAYWAEVAPGESVQFIVSETTANQIIDEYTASFEGVRSADVQFDRGTVTGSAELDREIFADYDVQLPFFIQGATLNGAVTVRVGAAGCRPVITVEKVRVGKLGIPVKGIGQEMIDETIREEWPPEACIEDVYITPEQLVVVASRR
ncbi:MAG: hypothetical protein JXB35_06360 [Anaerolineae bacterium]|nr:hypothetical protein [Anaerolineae bacterium]